MHKVVYTVFKAIFLSMMFVFIFDLGFYIFRAYTVNQKMETIMTSMQKVVIENNCLPQEAADMYVGILEQLAHDMNQGDIFITGIGINYNRDADGAGVLTTLMSQNSTGRSRNKLQKNMKNPGMYGDVMICQTKVQIAQPMWAFGNASNNVNNSIDYTYTGQDATQWNRVGYKTITMYYTYYVPCLKYRSIKDV